MVSQKRIRDYGVKIGRLEPGHHNAITDVEGVTVGHVTLSDKNMQNRGHSHFATPRKYL